MTSSHPIFQVDAFADRPFLGNSAAVMPMTTYLDDQTLQAIAMENNLSETAFIVPNGENRWQLRWFTPAIEVPLCGHATLASAHVIYNELEQTHSEIVFETRQSGELRVSRGASGYVMDFPADPPRQQDEPPGLTEALGVKPAEVWAGQYLIAVFETADQVRNLKPNIAGIEPIAGSATRGRGNLICVAPGDGGYDVVSRFFAPGSGIAEDPATGSAHCLIAPLFSDKLGKPTLSCFQAYPGRGAIIGTEMAGDRVKLSGNAVTVLKGEFCL